MDNSIHRILFTEFELVSNMNVAFFNPMGVASQKQITVASSREKLISQIKNILSEVTETQTALLKIINNESDLSKNLEDFRDGLCDIKVFALGAIHFIVNSELEAENFIKNLVSEDSGESTPYIVDTLNSVLVDTGTALGIVSSVIAWKPRIKEIARLLLNICANVTNLQFTLGIDPNADMYSVITGVMSRFCKDQLSLEYSIKIWKTKGVIETYTEGEFPTVVLKSAKDQPDAPKGKFLKSVDTTPAKFMPIDPDVLTSKLESYIISSK